MAEPLGELLIATKTAMIPLMSTVIIGETDPYYLESLADDQFPRAEILPYEDDEVGYIDVASIDEIMKVSICFYFKRAQKEVLDSDVLNTLDQLTQVKNVIRRFNRQPPCHGFNYVMGDMSVIYEFEFMEKISSVILVFSIHLNTNAENR